MSNCPSRLAEPVADMTIALMLWSAEELYEEILEVQMGYGNNWTIMTIEAMLHLVV